MNIHIVTPFPKMIKSIIESSILAKAEQRECVKYYVYDLFDFSKKCPLLLSVLSLFEAVNLINFL